MQDFPYSFNKYIRFMHQVAVSLVLFKSRPQKVEKAVKSALGSRLPVQLTLIDNSPDSELENIWKNDSRVTFIKNNRNVGYGAAHNQAIRLTLEQNIPYHLVMNPDIYFNDGVIEGLAAYLDQNPDVGQVMPKVLFPDGELQYLCKLLPTPYDLFVRRFSPFQSQILRLVETYELRFTGYNQIMEVPSLSGAFMFFRTDALRKAGLFDENFFMYLEDYDITRRVAKYYKTVFFPGVSVYHEFAKGSYKSRKLLWHHIQSALYYFNKWGWFSDPERTRINHAILKKLGR